LYLVKNRSNDCQKYKHFEDEEYEICGFKSGRGTDENAIVFKCKTTKGGEFDCRMRGSIEHRRELYMVGSTLIGKQLTVRYQEKDIESDVPRFPVGICIRDYE
jgi:ATP-dependent DNA ligase